MFVSPQIDVRDGVRLATIKSMPFLIVFILQFLGVPKAFATEPACILWAQDQTSVRPEWQNLGFEIRFVDLNQLSYEARARLLDDHHFILTPKGVQLSLTEGDVRPGWVPLIQSAPMSCAKMIERVRIDRQSREAAVQIFDFMRGLPMKTTLGEALLDMEYSYFFKNGLLKPAYANLKPEYLALLAKVKNIAGDPELDFFSKWLLVRREVYGKSGFHINYVDDLASITLGLSSRTFNCLGETFLLYALFVDAGFIAPHGWTLQLQVFTDHTRPVLWNDKTQTTFNLVDGGLGHARAAIFDPAAYVRGLWNNSKAPRFEAEKDFVNGFKVVYSYEAWDCIFYPRHAANRPTQPADISQVDTCDKFESGDQSNPKYADNAFKALTESYDEDQLIAEAHGKTAANRAAPPAQIRKFAEFIPTLNLISSEVNPSERAILQEAVAQGRVTPQMRDEFSIKHYVSELGQTYLLQTLESTPGDHWDWDEPVWPISVEKVDQERLDSVISKFDPGYIYFPFKKVGQNTDFIGSGNAISNTSGLFYLAKANCIAEHVICFKTSDQHLYDQLAPLGSAERLRFITHYLIERKLAVGREITQLLGDSTIPLSRRLDRLKDPKTLEVLRAFHLLTSMILNLPYNFNTLSGDPGTPISLAVRHALSLPGISGLEGMVELGSEIHKDPYSFIKWVESLSKDGLIKFAEPFRFMENSLGGLIDQKYQLNFEEPSLALWNRFRSNTPIKDLLLVDLLTDSHFFFTVRADQNELSAIRPTYPLSALDPRLLEKRETLIYPDSPKIKLTKLSFGGYAVCAPGTYGYQSMNGPDAEGVTIVVDCGEKRGPDPKSGHDKIDQSGQDDQKGVKRQARAANLDGKEKDGPLPEITAGEDKEGTLALKAPLSPQKSALPTSKFADQIRKGNGQGVEGLNLGDPRMEIDLKPLTWGFILSLGSTVANESFVKVLLHHTLRHALEPIYAYPRESTPFMVFSPADLNKNLLVMDADPTPPGHGEIRCQFSNVRPAPSVYGEYEQFPYFQAALKELEHPKNGYVFLQPEGLIRDQQSLIQDYRIFLQGRNQTPFPKPITLPDLLYYKEDKQLLFSPILSQDLKDLLQAHGMQSNNGRGLVDVSRPPIELGPDQFLAVEKKNVLGRRPFYVFYPVGLKTTSITAAQIEARFAKSTPIPQFEITPMHHQVTNCRDLSAP